MSFKKNLVIDRGSTYTLDVDLTEISNLSTNSTYTAIAKLKKHETSNSSITMTANIVSNTLTLTISLTANQTANVESGKYFYAVEATDTSTNGVIRILDGIVLLTPKII
jgi:PKD repeat protein